MQNAKVWNEVKAVILAIEGAEIIEASEGILLPTIRLTAENAAKLAAALVTCADRVGMK